MRRDPFDILDRPRIPLFFKLWFAFVLLLALVIIGGQLWLGATVLTNPEVVGRWVGEVLAGAREGAAK